MPTTLRIDNDGARELANNAMISAKTKHINLHYHYICECIDSKDIELKACWANENTADIFTKALPLQCFNECKSEMGVERVGSDIQEVF